MHLPSLFLPFNRLKFFDFSLKSFSLILLQGSTSIEVSEPNPYRAWLGDPAWTDLLALSYLPAFKDLKQSLEGCASKWEEIMETSAPFEAVSGLLGDGMDTFKKLCVLRCIRPDAVVSQLNELSFNKKHYNWFSHCIFIWYFFLSLCKIPLSSTQVRF